MTLIQNSKTRWTSDSMSYSRFSKSSLKNVKQILTSFGECVSTERGVCFFIVNLSFGSKKKVEKELKALFLSFSEVVLCESFPNNDFSFFVFRHRFLAKNKKNIENKHFQHLLSKDQNFHTANDAFVFFQMMSIMILVAIILMMFKVRIEGGKKRQRENTTKIKWRKQKKKNRQCIIIVVKIVQKTEMKNYKRWNKNNAKTENSKR